MADGVCPSDCNSFRLPPEPSPLSSIDSNEDSFVILWRDEESNTIKEVTTKQVTSNAINSANETNKETSIDRNGSDIPSITTLPSDLNSGEFRERVLEMMKENIFLKERFTENNRIMNVQHENIVALEQYYHEAQEQKRFIEKQQKEIRYLNDELEQLRNIKGVQDREIAELKETLARPSQDSSIVKSLEHAKKENAALRKDNQNLTLGLRQLRTIKDTQEKELDEVKQILVELGQEQRDVFEDSEVAKKETEELKAKLTELKTASEEKEKALSDDIERLKLELQLAEQRPSFDDMVRLERESKSAKVMLMQSEQSKMVADSHIEGLSREIMSLREELQEAQWQADQVYTLKAQLKVYEKDFEMEKRSKRLVKFKNVQLLEEVQNLRTCCHQLQEEVNEFREADPPRHTNSVPPDHTENISEVEQTVRLCPICAFGFNSLQALQNHVDRCLTNASDGN